MPQATTEAWRDAYRIQFFSNRGASGEADRFIGQAVKTTDGSGVATFTFVPGSKVALGRTITATATDLTDSDERPTSETSAPEAVTGP